MPNPKKHLPTRPLNPKLQRKGDVLQIGITGGIGTGKSTICKIFHTLGIAVYDSDSRAKALMREDDKLIADLKATFGEQVYDDKQQLNRTYLSKIVFNNEEKLNQLNAIVHPAVRRDYQNWVAASAEKSPYLLKEAALLYEIKGELYLDAVIVVSTPLEERIRRVLLRDTHRNEAQIRAIIAKQMPEEEKINKADFVIQNDNTHSVIEQVLALHRHFLKFV